MTPKVLTVLLANTQRTRVAIIHENESVPFIRRTVQISLTERQRRMIKPRVTGAEGTEATFEEIIDCWLEPRKPEAKT